MPIAKKKSLKPVMNRKRSSSVSTCFGAALRRSRHEYPQCIGLRLRQHTGGDRGVEILVLDAQSFSTVTLRLV